MRNINISLKRFLTITLFMGPIMLIFGCNVDREDKSGDSRTIAVINDYKLTVNDFESEADLTYPNRHAVQDWKEAKEGLLDDMITKKVLLQEAQKQNFDKDRAFMKEIERYWEQALLKLLIKKKTDEIANNIVVPESEIVKEYEAIVKEGGDDVASYDVMAPTIERDIFQQKIRDELSDWINDLEKTSDIKVDWDVLNEVKLNVKAEE